MRNFSIFLLLSLSIHSLILLLLLKPNSSNLEHSFSSKHNELEINIATASVSPNQLSTSDVLPENIDQKPVKKVPLPETSIPQKVTTINEVKPETTLPTKVLIEASEKATQTPSSNSEVNVRTFDLAPVKKQHPRGWIAFKVEIALDGSIKTFVQVSKEDANSVNLTRLENAIQNLKMPISDTEMTLLVSGPPLRIETDPALLSEYQIAPAQ